MIPLPIFPLLLIALNLSCLACNSCSNDHCAAAAETEHADIIDETKMETLMDRDDVLLVDNRPRAKYTAGHLTGAVNMPYFDKNTPGNLMTQEALKRVATGKTIIVFYCTGKNRAQNALQQAKQWNMSQKLYWYKNGYSTWSKQNRPVVRH